MYVGFRLDQKNNNNNTLVSGNAVDEKNVYPGGLKFIFLIDIPIFRKYSLFFFGFYAFLVFLFLCLVFVFWNYKYILFRYTFDYAGGWVRKNFHPTDSRKQDYFFFGLSIWTNQVLINPLLVSVSQKVSVTSRRTPGSTKITNKLLKKPSTLINEIVENKSSDLALFIYQERNMNIKKWNLNELVLESKVIKCKALGKVLTEAATQRCPYEKVFWKYAANLQENTHAEVQSNFIETALRHGCSPANLLHISRASFFKNTSGQLLLYWLFLL